MAISQIEQSLKFELLIPVRSGRAADRLHELQLSPRSFRHDLGPARPRPARSRIPAASRSASTGSRWRCSLPRLDLARWPPSVREALTL